MVEELEQEKEKEKEMHGDEQKSIDGAVKTTVVITVTG